MAFVLALQEGDRYSNNLSAAYVWQLLTVEMLSWNIGRTSPKAVAM